jgi:serine/threonine protein kinase/formylglycine-generating enzyme required for sulfatase activity
MENSESESNDRVALEVMLALESDRAAGRSQPLAVYLLRYPGFEEVVAREFVAAEAEASASGSVSEPEPATGAAFIGPYRIIRELGRGGQAVVYLAHDQKLARQVALKVISGGRGVSDDWLLRFRREAEVGSRLDHPGICTIFDIGREGGSAFIAMRYVPGLGFAEWVAERVAAHPEGAGARPIVLAVCELVEKCARILHAAHEAGIVHRDVKPSNVLVTDGGEPVVLDFGLARDQRFEGPTLTLAGDIFGTPGYMSPEQLGAGGGVVDRRSDVWALGVTLYKALTGHLPFVAATAEGLADRVKRGIATDPREWNGSIDASLAAILAVAIDVDPARRYCTALAFAEDLDLYRRGAPVAARPPGMLLRLRRWTRRSPLAAAVVASLLVIASVSAWFLVREARLLRESESRREKLAQTRDIRDVEALIAEEAQLWPISPPLAARAAAWIERTDAVLRRRALHESALRELRAGVERDAEDEWFESLLVDVLRGFDGLTAARARADDRRARAASQFERTVAGARDAWQACMSEIERSELYEETRLDPQTGFVPLGRSPQGLQELWMVETGERPRRDPQSGGWIIGPETGLVFVLVPAGAFTMGSVEEPRGRLREVDETPAHEVELDAFLISKYELTQAQWERMTGQPNPAFFAAGTRHGANFLRARRRPAVSITKMHPVEQVSWHDAVSALARWGLVLPTEARWEYACRAGTSTIWWCGDAPGSLFGCANLAGSERVAPEDVNPRAFADDHPFHAPVGSYRANPWGLHDVYGNVAEWTLDPYGMRYTLPPREGDGFHAGDPDEDDRTQRGGSFASPGAQCRSAERNHSSAARIESSLGIRAVRELEKR